MKLHEQKIQYYADKSRFIHRELKSIQGSGGAIESELRCLIQQLLPSRFRVTHGYAVNATSIDEQPVVSPQIDLIIVDSLVPNSLFLLDDHQGGEVVPVDAIVGIIEIKRTINRESLLGKGKNKNGAMYHLHKISTMLKISKEDNNRYLPGGILLGNKLQGGNYANPFFGVISLCSHPEVAKRPQEVLSQKGRKKAINCMKSILDEFKEYDSKFKFIDMIASLDGYVLAKADSSGYFFDYANPWSGHSGFVQNYRGQTLEGRKVSISRVISLSFGYLLSYLSKTSGKYSDLSKYYFNKNV